MKKTIIALLLLSSLAYAANRNWQEGIIVNAATSENGAAAMPIGNMAVVVPLRSVRYRITTADLSIVANSPKTLNVTMNKPVRIAIDKQHLFLIDDEGKERKLFILRKEAR